MLNSMPLKVRPRLSSNPEAQKTLTHHVGNPPTSFKNPWPSSAAIPFSKVFQTRFLRKDDKNNVPIPTDRSVLVPVRKPDWGESHLDKLRATWLGHASFLVETVAQKDRGVRILFDPVFSERTSPVQWFGPKRYNPTPCQVDDLPEVDIIAISHNHYDHLDSWTIKEVWRASRERNRTPLIACALGNKPFFRSLLPELPEGDIIELDWWDSVQIDVQGIGSIELSCTPAQHTSARSFNDKDHTLWCSYVVRDLTDEIAGQRLFFAGDTGYRRVLQANPSEQEEQAMPCCPAFTGDAHWLTCHSQSWLSVCPHRWRSCLRPSTSAHF